MRKLLRISIFSLMILVAAMSISFGSTAEENAIPIRFSEMFIGLTELSEEAFTELSDEVYSTICLIEGNTISFDGHIDSIGKDLVVYPGNYEDDFYFPWGFIIKDYRPDSTVQLTEGNDVIVTATIAGQNDLNMIVLDKASIEFVKSNLTETNETKEEIIDNEFSIVLEGNSTAQQLCQFASKYKGCTVEFDGYISSFNDCWPNDEEYELIVENGDFANRSGNEVSFRFDHVTMSAFGLNVSEPPSFMRPESDVHIVGTILEYDDFYEEFLLAPVSITYRNHYTENISDISSYVELAKGSKGDYVKGLQQRLIELKYLKDKADGQYGNNTKTAVEKFQTACLLEVTGIADPMTQAVLFSDKAPEAKLEISCSSLVVGSVAQTAWYVDGQEFTLKGSKTKTVTTVWGTYKFDAYGKYERIGE